VQQSEEAEGYDTDFKEEQERKIKRIVCTMCVELCLLFDLTAYFPAQQQIKI